MRQLAQASGDVGPREEVCGRGAREAQLVAVRSGDAHDRDREVVDRSLGHGAQPARRGAEAQVVVEELDVELGRGHDRARLACDLLGGVAPVPAQLAHAFAHLRHERVDPLPGGDVHHDREHVDAHGRDDRGDRPHAVHRRHAHGHVAPPGDQSEVRGERGRDDVGPPGAGARGDLLERPDGAAPLVHDAHHGVAHLGDARHGPVAEAARPRGAQDVETGRPVLPVARTLGRGRVALLLGHDVRDRAERARGHRAPRGQRADDVGDAAQDERDPVRVEDRVVHHDRPPQRAGIDPDDRLTRQAGRVESERAQPVGLDERLGPCAGVLLPRQVEDPYPAGRHARGGARPTGSRTAGRVHDLRDAVGHLERGAQRLRLPDHDLHGEREQRGVEVTRDLDDLAHRVRRGAGSHELRADDAELRGRQRQARGLTRPGGHVGGTDHGRARARRRGSGDESRRGQEVGGGGRRHQAWRSSSTTSSWSRTSSARL
ncbi:hypothetical protein OJAG_02220 [Oerskovia enterophila]|uniref:Uncharacterized protein n=1 Tax=Oerskovia enterophila TaxID=43678 RepID=A0A163T4P1_9CELL|nr:hypothetical protein OJAG_02220 [Oerskovia enterophila]